MIQEKFELEKLVNESNSLSEILRKQGKAVSGASVNLLKEKLNKYKINYSFLDEKTIKNKKPLEEILVINSTYSSKDLLNRLIKERIKEYKCEKCGISSWQNEVLRLQLHHINGIHTDNTLSNLQVLCPNCHSQTDNWGNKGNKYYCKDCGCEINRRSTYCKKCASKYRATFKNVYHPSKEELEAQIYTVSFTELGKKYNVSDNSVRKWCKKFGLPSTKKEIRQILKDNNDAIE